jgi:hypothetical protein
MIAMANPFAGYLTIRQVMQEIGARAPSTVNRLVYDEDKPRPAGKRLAGTLIPGHGWMIQRKSLEAFIAEEAAKPRGVGFPRGHSRAAEPEAEKPKAKKPVKRAAKSARAVKKT